MKQRVYWKLDKIAAQKADLALWAVNPELHGRKLTMNVRDGKYRKQWMDLYVLFGGHAEEVGESGVRIATPVLNDEISKNTDQEFYSRHPTMTRKISLKPRDARLRKEWIDIYQSLGGQLVEIGRTGIRIPAALVNA